MIEAMSRDELMLLPAVVRVEDAGRALGFGRQHSYNLVRQGLFPVPVLKLGNRYKIPTAPLLKYLGVEPAQSVDTQGLASNGAPSIRRAIRTHTKSGKPVDPSKYYRVDGERVLGADLVAGTW